MTTNESLQALRLAFIGKLLAGVSHEFKNHLAIIRELSGLIQDLLMYEKPGQPPNRDRYKKIISEIDDRILQAAEMCRFFSQFSHRMDEPFSSFSVRDVLQEEIYLLRRFARQQQVDLESTFAEDLPVIFNDPSLLQFAIFCITQPALEQLNKNDRILITAARQDSAVKIVVHIKGERKIPEEGKTEVRPELFAELVKKLNAELISTPCGHHGEEEVILLVPSVPHEQPCT